MSSALTFYQQRDLDNARRLTQQVLDEFPDHHPALLLAARIALYQRDYASTGELAATILDDRPDHSGALLLRARALLHGETAEPAEALKLLEHVVEMDSGHAEAWYLRGLALEKLDRLPDAITSYRTAAAAGQRLAAAHVRLSALYVKAKLNREAQYHANVARILGGAVPGENAAGESTEER